MARSHLARTTTDRVLHYNHGHNQYNKPKKLQHYRTKGRFMIVLSRQCIVSVSLSTTSVIASTGKKDGFSTLSHCHVVTSAVKIFTTSVPPAITALKFIKTINGLGTNNHYCAVGRLSRNNMASELSAISVL